MRDSYFWLLSFHIFGFIMWTGTMIGLANLLAAHGEASPDHRPAFHAIEKRMAMAMDVGAALAIGFGLALLFSSPMRPLSQPWMHIKLTLIVLGFLGMHGFVRVKVRKFREGEVVPLPGFVIPLLSLLLLAVIFLAILRPLAK